MFYLVNQMVELDKFVLFEMLEAIVVELQSLPTKQTYTKFQNLFSINFEISCELLRINIAWHVCN